jgi:pimeloyl-ACP methyl ester carboxylesterase
MDTDKAGGSRIASVIRAHPWNLWQKNSGDGDSWLERRKSGLAILRRSFLFPVVKSWRHFLFLALGLAALAFQPVRAIEPDVVKSSWNGFDRLDFTVAGRSCLLVVPAKPAPGGPWIWRTEFFGVEPQVDLALLAAGWHVAYMDAKDMYGAPAAMALFGAFYAHIVANYELSPRVVLEGFSRGGLYAFNFAVAHPNRVAALYLDAPVLDIRSWPGRTRDSKEWAECLAIYGLTEQTVGGFKGNPLDHIDGVARAGVPIIAVCGDADTLVPFGQNTAVLEKRYRELGGTIQVILKPGGDHHPHSLKDPAPIVNFLTTQAKF